MANNQNKITSILRKIAEGIGLDEIPFAIGLVKFTSDAPFFPTKLKEIESKVEGLTGKKIEDSLSYCKEMLDSENRRGEKIEKKASSLLGVTGISTAFITGVMSLISDNQIPILFWLILVQYILIVLSLTLTVLLASRVIIVGEYKYAYPDISDVLRIGSQNLEKVKIERISSYLYCYANNYKIHNSKASYLIGAQSWFRNTIILFLLLGLSLTLSIQQNRNVNITPSIFPATMTITPTSVTTSQPTAIITPPPGLIHSTTPSFSPTTFLPSSTTQPSPAYSPIAPNQAMTSSTP